MINTKCFKGKIYTLKMKSKVRQKQGKPCTPISLSI